MSLETSLDKNNELLERKTALLEQQNSLIEQQNTLNTYQAELLVQHNELMAQFVSALAIFKPNIPAANDDQSIVATVEQPAKPKKSSVKKAVDTTPVDIETLDLETVVAIAVLFKNDAYNLTADKLAQARAVIDGIGEAERNGQVDALDCALQGLPELKPLTNAVILDLCLEMVANWDDIPGITERREFAVALLNEGKQTTEPEPEPEPEPEFYAALYDQTQQALLRLAKGGYRNEATGIVHKFGAKKLGDIPQEKLPEVLKLAEAAWVEE
ncbi:hypothetical protein [Xenorhabdus eapokensis]|uniref:Uncharacterized protein n=1 Tax=Xenorhabdus eapokensis TaxID=1873482 RepID=A0A1Q5TQV3_9GAMM|nr:hypothetical protein [Xenorhabdus eapokensis]OKP02587.1 hypothetical protein Xedl_02238 [Xenorhabdus eapokensis]